MAKTKRRRIACLLCSLALLGGLLPLTLLHAQAASTPNIYLGERVVTDVLQRRYSVKAGTGEKLHVTGMKKAVWSSDNEGVVTVQGGVLSFTGGSGYARITASNGNTSLGVTYYISSQPKSLSTDDDPSYPDEGAIHIGKSALGIDFQTTAVAQVELSVSGVPLNRPKDIVLVVDCSSSMSGERITVAKAALQDLIAALFAPHADGTPSGNRIALVGFNDYDAEAMTNNRWSPSADSFSYGKNILSGGQTVADAFTDADGQSVLSSAVSQLERRIHTGTNYDLGMQTAYEILYASRNDQREKAVIFMSDGAPYQYNYQRGSSGNGQWGRYIATTPLAWADAIKGASGSTTVTVPYATALPECAYTGNFQKSVPNLGADLYAIGFCLGSDRAITQENMKDVLKNMSGGSGYYYYAQTASSLSGVFAEIAGKLSYAATDAVVTDTLGSGYALVTSSAVAGTNPVVDLSDSAHLGRAPAVEVGRWTLSDAGARETFESVESFPLEGQSGDLHGEYFTYTASTGTFSWNIGTVAGSYEYILRYPVSLTGALLGTLGAGSYPTNNRATLSYVNYLGHRMAKDFPVPAMPWQAINVTCEYYLVNAAGQPISAEGAVIPLSQATFYPTETFVIYYNADQVFQATIGGGDRLPHGCRLYNPESAYYIRVGSGSNESVARIRDDGATQTTFLIQPAGAAYSSNTATIDARTYNLLATHLADYTNTHIAFAVTTAPIEDEQLQLPQTGGFAVGLLALSALLALTGGAIVIHQRKISKNKMKG